VIERSGGVTLSVTRGGRGHVEGMACDRLSARLRDNLRKFDGVLEVAAGHRQKEVVVREETRGSLFHFDCAEPQPP
jgi:hypothetical protein